VPFVPSEQHQLKLSDAFADVFTKEVLSYGKFRSFEKILVSGGGNSNRRQFP
jgi:hypothetical protein